MNRMEAILEKAEREGTMRRATAPPPVAPAPPQPSGAPRSAAGAAVAVPALPSIRAVRQVHVDPCLAVVSDPEGPVAEQYRAIRTRILHADHGSSIHVLLVTSPSHGDGKSVTAANLALTMARAYDQRTCVVDTDLRMPRLHRLLGLSPDAPGLSDVLAGHISLDEALTRVEEYDLTVLPAGGCPPRPSELLATTAMRRVLDTLRSRFDCIVVDAPAVLPLSDVGTLTPLVDRVVLVVREGVTRKADIREATAAIGPGAVLGVIYNDHAA
jgi:capsular exopolysaccharide synthesis family protein